MKSIAGAVRSHTVALSLAVTFVILPDTHPASLHAGGPELVPFEVDWHPVDGALLDLSFLLDPPAGRDGPLRVEGGHLVTAGGRRLRIWGVNLTGAACFPEQADAARVAGHLGRHGINCVRFHFLDSNWGADASLFDRSRDDTRALDPDQLDRLDAFVAALKARGIYSDFNLNVGRVYRREDGVIDHEYLGLGKAVQYYDSRVGELHREYARLLMTHRNPYTGSQYREEPAIAFVELVNENSLVESWFAGRLRGTQKTRRPGTWSDITRHYADLLTHKYNVWLEERLKPEELRRLRRESGIEVGQPIPRLEPQQFESAKEFRFHTEARFYMELEDAYFQSMRHMLRGLGVRALVIATSDHNHWKSGYPLLASASRLDAVDGHVYWQHPRYIRENGRTTGFWIANTPMVNEPLDSTVVQLARSAVAGKPYTVSETNHPFPNSYAAEGIPILAVYALLQDWDGIFFYTFAHEEPREWLARTPGHFDLRADPVKMTLLAAAALVFHRGDVRRARRTIGRAYSRRQVIESLRLPSSERPLFTPGLSPVLPLIHATRIESFERASDGYRGLPLHSPITADTGELKWHHGPPGGLVTVDTARTQAAIGHVASRQPELTHLVADVENQFCSLVLTSADGEPLARSERMLLAATARSELTGMRWDESRHTLLDWGRPPFRIEPVRGTLRLGGRESDAPLEVIPLDGAGRPLGGAVSITPVGGSCEVSLAEATTWYLVRSAAPGDSGK